MRSSFKKIGALAALAAFLLPVVVKAAPPAIDPTYRTPNVYGQDSADPVGSIYMNQNQLAIRLTGRDYNDHVDPTGPGLDHWLGSGLGLIENTVNDLIINARFPASGALGCANGCDKLLRNWVDVILKRVFDGNPLTPLDYDTQSFLYVDTEHPALRLPPAPNGATLTDLNNDGDEHSWEPTPVLDALCLPAIPGFGDMCLTMYIVNVQSNGTTDVVLPTAPVAYVNASNDQVNDPSRPAIDFSRYNDQDTANTSHMLMAAKANLTFDNEIEGCDSPEFAVIPGGGDCDASIYRDDDDGLYVEIELASFKLDVLFEPPFTSATTADTLAQGCTADIDGGAGICGRAAARQKAGDWYAAGPTAGEWAVNITDMTDGDTFTDDIGGNDYVGNGGPWPVPGCPDLEGGDEYAPECDLSNYLKLYGTLVIPELRIALSVRIVSSYTDIDPGDWNQATPPTTDDMPVGPDASTDVINFGVVLQSLEVSTDLIFVINAGPYCEDDLDFSDLAGAALGSAAQGFDAMGIFPWRTDNPNNCDTPADNDNTPNASDDSTYLKSEKFAAVLSYVRAEVLAVMEDFFDPATNPGFFFGPTRLLDVGSLLTSEIDWPLAGGTDYLYMLLSLDSGVDSTTMTSGQSPYRTLDQGDGPNKYRGDSIEEFWADQYGVMMPFNAGFGFDWFDQSATTPTPTRYNSCVTNEASYTGYQDGYRNSLNGGVNADNPVVSRPLPSLKTEWTGNEILDNADDHSATLLGRKIPDVNGEAPFALTDEAVPYPSVATGAYAFGLGIHQNFLSKLMYEMVIKGLLCMSIDSRSVDPYAFVSDLTLLNTGTFGFFMPYLADNFPDADMYLRILPLVADPNNLYWPSVTSPGANYASRITEAQSLGDLGGGYPVTSAVSQPVPRIIVGGINTFDALKGRYAGEITTAYFGPIWPDLSIVIPHLVMEFYVYDDTIAANAMRRAFALDIGLNFGINIDITQDPGVGGPSTVLDNGDPNGVNSDVDTTNDFTRPQYFGTDFPIGCGPDVAYGCEVTGVPSRLVVFLGGIVDPEVNAVLVYDEIQNGVASPITTEEAYTVAGATDPTLNVYKDAISNLLGIALSSEISFFAEIGLDPAALIDIPIVLTVPYIGPSFVYRTVGGNFNGKDPDLGCDAPEFVGVAVPDCQDPLGINTDRDVSDNDTNGFGDYLIAAVSVDVTYVTSDYLFRLIDTFLEPIFYDCDNLECQTEYYVLGSFLDDLLGAAPAAPTDGFHLPNGYVSPETYIKGIRKAHATETLIDFEGFHPTESADLLTYAWRVDGGFWTPFVKWNSIRIPGLLEGKHLFEVKAKDSHGNVEWTPARIEFTVDSVAPKANIVGDRVQPVDSRFFVEVRDTQSMPEDVRVAYSIDGGEFSRYGYSKDIALNVSAGRHTLNVRTIDEAGNVSLTSLNFSAEDGGFGCSVAGNGASADASLLLLAIPVIVIAIRRRRPV